MKVLKDCILTFVVVFCLTAILFAIYTLFAPGGWQ